MERVRHITSAMHDREYFAVVFCSYESVDDTVVPIQHFPEAVALKFRDNASTPRELMNRVVLAWAAVSCCMCVCILGARPARGQDVTDLLDEGEREAEIDDLVDEGPRALFYAPLDGSSEGRTPKFIVDSTARDYFEKMTLDYEPGMVGKAAQCYQYFVSYPADDVLDRERGTLSFWFKWNPSSRYKHSERFSTGHSCMVSGNLYGARSIFETKDDGWHHWVITWDADKRQKTLYQDGKLLRTDKLGDPFTGGLLLLGRGIPGLLDEIVVLDRPLEADQIRGIHGRTRAGKPSWPGVADLSPKAQRYPWAIESSGRKRPSLPAGVMWEAPLALSNAARKRYDLTGTWRVQPFGTRLRMPTMQMSAGGEKQRSQAGPQDGPWAYSTVPGSWRPHGNLRQRGTLFPRPGGKRLERWQGTATSLYPCAWMERDLSLPESARGSGAYLVCEGVHDECDFYVNDAYVGTLLPWQKKEFRIPDAVKWGGTNRLTVLAGRPYGTYQHVTRERETIWEPSGLSCPVYLEVRRSRHVSVSQIYAMPYFRRKCLDVEFLVRNHSGERRNLAVACQIKDLQSGQSIQLGSLPCELLGAGEERLTLSFPWAEPILWFPDDPRLLGLTLTFSEAGQVIDQTFPVRFGFRELWAEDGYLWMNGVRFWLRGTAHGWESAAYLGGRPRVKQYIEHVRRRGMNSAIGNFLAPIPAPYTEMALDVADEMGFLTGFSMGLCGGGRGTARERESYFREWLRQYRNHPCVIAYNWHVTGYSGAPSGSPISIGRAVADEEKELPAYKRSVYWENLLRGIDPTRLVAFYTRGVVGDYRSLMQYTGYGTPLQSREEWPRYWAAERPAPFVGTEISMWMFLYGWLWQKGFGTATYAWEHGTPPLPIEHGARYFGNAAYEMETTESVRRIRLHEEQKQAYELRDNANYQALSALVVKHCCRSWRTYGMSYQLHCVARHTHLPELPRFAPVDQSLADHNQPFLAYVAGPPGDFVTKEHAFFGGETVTKQIVLINGHYHPVEAKVEWRLVEAGSGRTLRSFAETFALKGGDVVKHPFSFALPEVGQKTACRIELAAKHGDEAQVDVSALEAFPREDPPDLAGRSVLVIDEEGDTSRVLRKAGIAFRPLALSDGWEKAIDSADLVVIGRKSLPQAPETIIKLYRKAEAGLSILCFEQVAKNVFGLENDDPNTRHAFVSAADHPVVAGLGDEDFRNWRGASDILECYPDYRKGVEYGWMNHGYAKGYFGQNEFAHWSSKGTVAAFHFEKPQTGDFTAILSSGFDMLYTPLVELRPGRGRIVVCSLDVTNRYGIDPVATRVVNRLLQYSGEQRRSDRTPAAAWGNPYWKDVLAQTGADFRWLDDPSKLDTEKVLWLGIGDCPPRAKPMKKAERAKAMTDAVELPAKLLDEGEGEAGDDEDTPADEKDVLGELADTKNGTDVKLTDAEHARVRELEERKGLLSRFISNGGTAIVAVTPQECVKWLPLDLRLGKTEEYLGDPRGIEELSGLTCSDFFFREVFDMPDVTSVPEGSRLQGSPFIAAVPFGKGKIILCQLYPALFHDAWQKTKVLRIISTLLARSGVRFQRTIELANPQDLTRLWYAAPALDFNPDKHRSW